MKRLFKVSQGLVMVAVAMLLAAGCGSSSSDRPDRGGPGGSGERPLTIQLAGLVAKPVTARLVSAQDAPEVDKVVALRLERGSLSSFSMSMRVEAPVEDDGSFTMALSTESDWLLVLIDSNREGMERFLGTVNVPLTEGEDGLIGLPISVVESEAIDLGEVSLGDDEDAVAEEAVDDTHFALNASQLLALAKTDNVFRNAKNIVANFHVDDAGEETWYAIRADFSWQDTTLLNDSEFSHPADLERESSEFQMDTNSETLTIQQICGEGVDKVLVGLFPPGEGPELTNSDEGPCEVENGVTNYISEYLFAGSNPEHTDKTLSYVFKTDSVGDLDAGYWEWREDDEVKAVFDLGIASPVTAEGEPAGFVPSIKLDWTEDGILAAVLFQWYYHDGTGYVLVEDESELSMLRHVLEKVEVGFYEMGHGTDTAEKIDFDPAEQFTIAPDEPNWTRQEDDDLKLLEKIHIFYESGGIGRIFIFRVIGED